MSGRDLAYAVDRILMKNLFTILMAVILIACGGSGGSSTEPTNPEPTNPEPTNPEPTNPEPTNPESESELDKSIRALGLNILPIDSTAFPKPEGALFELGKQLFFSKSLSRNFETACVSCHHPYLGGGDDLSLPVGVGALDPLLLGPGRVHDGNRLVDPLADGGPNVARNSPTTFNLALYDRSMFWDGRIEVLDSEVKPHGRGQGIKTPDSLFGFRDIFAGDNLSQAQARFPLTSINEMFGHGIAIALVNQLRRLIIENRVKGTGLQSGDLPVNGWLPLFKQAYSDASNDVNQVVTLARITAALSHYQQTQLLVDNPWFSYLKGNAAALSDDAKRGALLFYKPLSDGGYACSTCHVGNNLSDEKFYNLAMPQLGRGKDRNHFDVGRLSVSGNGADKYRFRTPSLLNAEITGPWGHAGAFVTLKDTIRHHLNVDTSLAQYDYTLASLSQYQYVPVDSDRIKSLVDRALLVLKTSDEWDLLSHENVNEDHVEHLAEFLKALTDPCVKSKACMDKWIPSNTDKGPDNNRLLASFATFDDQINTHTPNPDESGSGVGGDSGRYFSDVSVAAGLNYELAVSDNASQIYYVAGGVTVADYDGDGWEDFFVSHAMQSGKLFRNNQDGTFVDKTLEGIGALNTIQLGGLFFDMDADGDKDLLLSETKIENDFVRVLTNDGDGTFTHNINSGIRFSRFTSSFSAGDYDTDGDFDLLSAHWVLRLHEQNGKYLWENDGAGHFMDNTDRLAPRRSEGHYGSQELSFTPNFADIDGDNDLDILISSDFETSQVLNNQNGVFNDVTTGVISDENGMGAAIGDYDNDGDLDWFVTSIWNPVEGKSYVGGESGNRLYNNNGSGTFSDVTEVAGVRKGYWGWGACFADFNNDGWLDLFHTNGMTVGLDVIEDVFKQFANDPSRLFINDKEGGFNEKSEEYGIGHVGQGRGISCFDYDHDGDVDILIANNGAAPNLYRNNSIDENNYLQISLLGVEGNREAIGAKVTITIGENSQFRELRLGSNYLSNDPVIAHFGVEKNTRIDSIYIRWPDGSERTLLGMNVNQHLRIGKAGDVLRVEN